MIQIKDTEMPKRCAECRVCINQKTNDYGGMEDMQPYEEAVDMAINILKQEPCEDTISRQAVINAIANTCFWLSADNWEELTECINSISTVTLQPRWIPISEGLPKESGKYLVTFGGTHLVGIDFYSTEEDAKKIFEEPEEEDIGWHSHNVVAWVPLPEPYNTESEE